MQRAWRRSLGILSQVRSVGDRWSRAGRQGVPKRHAESATLSRELEAVRGGALNLALSDGLGMRCEIG